MSEEVDADLVDRMIAFEGGDLSNGDGLLLFADLIKNGMAWQLQGAYGRMAGELIERGFITPEGAVTDTGQELIDADATDE